MPDIPAATPVSPASSATSSPGNNIVVETAVNSVPDKILQLARQIEVSGTLAAAPANNGVTLNTVIGPLILLLPQLAQAQQEKLLQQLIMLFQTQRPLTVVLQPGNPPAQAFLLLPPATPASQYQSTAANFFQPSALPQEGVPLLPNITLSAVVLPEGITFPSTISGQAGLTLYTNLNPNAGLVSGAVPTVIPDPAVATPVPEPPGEAIVDETLIKLEGQGLPNAPPQPAAIPTVLTPPATGVAALLQPGAELTLRINAVIASSTQDTAPISPPQGNQILATVTGNAPGGQVILKSGDATLFVRQSVDAPVGTQLLLTVEPARPDVPLFTFSDQPQFAALQQLLAVLQQIDPAAAHAMLAARMPMPGETLPGALLFFLSAMRQGDVRNWLGNGTPDLLARAGKAELIGKLAQELQQAVQPGRDSVVGEWRTYQVPLYDNNHLSALYFHIHGHRHHASGQQGGKDGKDGKPDPAQMRFVIDVRMSRLGSLQLDGFLRQRQLDIIVRSENPLPPWLNQDLRNTYVKTLDAIGYTGGLNFQNGRQGWLNVQKPAVGAAITT